MVNADRDDGGTVPLPPLFSPLSVRKQEYWQFAKLIAPQQEIPAGKRSWTADDAIGIWCLRCSRRLTYQKGSSQSIRYHMETKHADELAAFRHVKKHEQQQQQFPSVSPPEPLVSSLSPTTTAAIATATATATATIITSTTTVDATNNNQVLKRKSGSLDQPNDAAQEVPPKKEKRAAVSQTTSANSTANSNKNTTSMSWARNLERRGGFWGDAAWYDLHLTRRMPLVKPMLDELIAALPPCNGKRVLDLCAGSGQASAALLQAYPHARVTLLDSSQERLEMARSLLSQQPTRNSDALTYVHSTIDLEMRKLPGGPYDVVIGSLAFHVLVEKPAHYARTMSHDDVDEMAASDKYQKLFVQVFESLNCDGHLIFADHVGMLPLFDQLFTLHQVGFRDVDCAWRQDEFFVAGGVKPSHRDA